MSTGLMLPHSHPTNALLVIRATLQQNFHPLYEILHLLQDLQLHFTSLLHRICIALSGTFSIWQSMREFSTKALVHLWVRYAYEQLSGTFGNEYVYEVIDEFVGDYFQITMLASLPNSVQHGLRQRIPDKWEFLNFVSNP